VTGLEQVARTGAPVIAANHLSAGDEIDPVPARRQVVCFARAEYFTQLGMRGRFVVPVLSG
jgi:1-acyl-sn-glycerol-3-phosphate acyltransferase